MKWPWVARERLDEAHERIALLEAEHRRLINHLLGLEHRFAAAQEEPGLTPFRGSGPAIEERAIPTGNPFDSIEDRLSRALRAKKVPAQFKARA